MLMGEMRTRKIERRGETERERNSAKQRASVREKEIKGTGKMNRHVRETHKRK